MATTVSYSASLCTRHTNSSSNAKNGYASQMLCMTLEKAIEYIAPDEYVEVTPENTRLRKKILNFTQRKRAERQAE